MVIPRAHDCITLFLGARERYQQEFNRCPGTCWYVQDFIERGAAEGTPLSIGATTAAQADARLADYVEKYGTDNAAYLMEVMNAWQAHYERAAFIDIGVGDGCQAAEHARQQARRLGWRFERLAGDVVLIKRLLEADWDTDFLILQPGQTFEMTDDAEIIRGV